MTEIRKQKNWKKYCNELQMHAWRQKPKECQSK